jgi:hypothetical protein
MRQVLLFLLAISMIGTVISLNRNDTKIEVFVNFCHVDEFGSPKDIVIPYNASVNHLRRHPFDSMNTCKENCKIIENLCDDDNKCTIDTCNKFAGNCVYDDVVCNDNSVCTADHCNSSIGCYFVPIPCEDDNDVCTIEYCDPINGCQIEQKNCDDKDPCTIDTCDSTSGCIHTEKNCEDGNMCTYNSCNSLTGECEINAWVICQSNFCNNFTCNPSTGKCDVVGSRTCPDKDPCNVGICTLTGCTHVQKDCRILDLCNVGSCNITDGGCISSPKCVNNNPCKRVECILGTCTDVYKVPDGQQVEGCNNNNQVCSNGFCTTVSCEPSNLECFENVAINGTCVQQEKECCCEGCTTEIVDGECKILNGGCGTVDNCVYNIFEGVVGFYGQEICPDCVPNDLCNFLLVCENGRCEKTPDYYTGPNLFHCCELQKLFGGYDCDVNRFNSNPIKIIDGNAYKPSQCCTQWNDKGCLAHNCPISSICCDNGNCQYPGFIGAFCKATYA